MNLASAPSPVGVHLLNATRQLNLHRPFNPAIIALDDETLLTTIRSSDNQMGTKTSILITRPHKLLVESCINISSINRKLGVSRTNDARLFHFAEQVFITFNNGHPQKRSEYNNVYIQPIYPALGDPIELQIDSRQRIEKNIMFRENSGALLASYRYSLSEIPVTIAVDRWQIRPDHNRQPSVEWESQEQIRAARVPRKTYGQGTPWILVGNRLVAILNERFHWGGFRSYRGRLVVQTAHGRPSLRAQLYHNNIARLGPVFRRNPRLLHATYFLGLTVFRGRLLTSYGINDQSFGVAELNCASLDC